MPCGHVLRQGRVNRLDSVHCVHGWIILFAAGQPGVPDLSGRDVNDGGCAVEMMIISVGIKF